MSLIKVNVIRQWPEKQKRECENNAPLLLRKLILESCHGQISNLDIPYGDAVAYSGFDGNLFLNNPFYFLPDGEIFFEIGTDKNIKSKAENDYNEAKKKSKDIDHKNCTFAFFTPRLFNNAKEWAIEKRKEKYWKDVIVINATKIEFWLSLCPITSFWLAVEQKLVFGSSGHEILSTFWDRTFTKRNLSILPELHIGSRSSQKEELLSNLKMSSIIAIKSSSMIESLAFYIASIRSEAVNEYESISLIVTDQNIIKDSAVLQGKLIFVCLFYDISIFNLAEKNGHKIIFPTDHFTDTTQLVSIKLPRIEQRVFHSSLEKSGFTYDKAKQLAIKSNREVAPFLYITGFITLGFEWNETSSLQFLIPAIITGSWDESKDGDRAAIEILAKCDYNTYISSINIFITCANAPLAKAGTLYKFKFQHLALDLCLSKKIAFDFEAIETISVLLYSERNPVLELKPLERPWADIRGIKHVYSQDLSTGLLNSLTHIALSKIESNGINCQNFVNRIIGNILETEDINTWRSFSNMLQKFAEAAPDIFIQTIKSKLESNSPVIKAMFHEETNIFFPKSYHTELLWALESLAWFQAYFEESCYCLFLLAKVDPGGSISNRPINSLKAIFCTTNPHTRVNEIDRIIVLKRIYENAPQQVFKIILSIIENDWLSNINASFEFRENYDDKLSGNMEAYISLAIEFLLQFNTFSDEELISICNASFAQLPRKLRIQLLDIIVDNFNKSKNKDELHNFLGSKITQYEILNDSEHLNSNELKPYIMLFKQQRKNYPLTEIKAAFANENPYFIFNKKRKDQKDIGYTEVSLIQRFEILKKFKKDYGFQLLLKLVDKVEAKQIFGFVLANLIIRVPEIDLAINYFLSKESRFIAVNGFACRKVQVHGEEWILNKYKKLSSRSLPLIQLLIPLKATKNLWSFIESLGVLESKKYWLNIDPWFWDLEGQDIEFGVNKLNEVGRGAAAFHILRQVAKKLSSKLIIYLLHEVGVGRIVLDQKINKHDIISIFEELYQKEFEGLEDEMLNIEVLWFDAFDLIDNEYPRVLLKKLSTEPAFIMDFIIWAFIPEDSFQGQYSIENEARASKSWKILYYLKMNTYLENPIDQNIESFKNYFQNLRSLAKVNKRIKSTDNILGKIIGSILIDENWPPNYICELIEQTNSEEFIQSFEITLKNGRKGFRYTFGSGVDRNNERAIYFKSIANKIRFKYPKVAKSLDRIEESFKHSASFWADRNEENDLRDY